MRQIWSKSLDSATPLFAFEKDGKVGFIDPTGRVVLAPFLAARIESVGDFVGGYARVEGKGVIDAQGKWLVKDDDLGWHYDYADGSVLSLERYVFPDKSELIPTVGERYEPFSEGLAAFRRIRHRELAGPGYLSHPGKAGFMDKSGKVAVEPTYADVGPFRNGLARVVLDGYCHIAGPEGWLRGTPTTGIWDSCGGPPQDASTPCKTGFVSKNGTLAIPADFQSARDFQEGLAAVRTSEGWGFIDTTGQFVIPPGHQLVRSFRNGFAPFQSGDKWGFLDRTGRIRIAPDYDAVGEFSQGLAVVTRNGQSWYVDENGRTAVRGPFLEATPFVLGLAATRTTRTRVTYIDRTGRPVFTWTLAEPY